MRRALAGLSVLLACTVGAAPVAATTKAPHPKPAAKVRCHLVRVGHSTRHRRVCVRVKHRSPAVKAVPGGQRPAGAAPALPLSAPSAVIATPLTPTTPAAEPTAAFSAEPAAVVVAVPAAPPVPAPARLQVTAREFSLQLSRPSVASGSLVLELVNEGEDQHDLHVRPATGGADVAAISRIDPFGGVGSTTGKLAAGTYTVYCSLPGHEAAGMHATLPIG